MGEVRSDPVCGPAARFSWLHFLTGTDGLQSGPVPDAAKFEGKWFGGEDPEDNDAFVTGLAQGMKEGKYGTEKVAEHYKSKGIEMDSVYWRHHAVNGGQLEMARPLNLPTFTDLTANSAFSVAYDMTRWGCWLRQQWGHCKGNLGEDSPTCQKARWYFDMVAAPFWKTYYEELGELGHFEAEEKWGVKPRVSFLPVYQPVKKNIPGAYEFYQSEQYLDNWSADGEGSIGFPMLYQE
eukprot:TRINITY_DN5834_c1_g1_i2.p1 TRINITY_DN5834_c1_g1~~TRINITY_DN5834_c1_g1_i2.p1  ORF type:complete len:261 (+),score=106.36 TRINITY_DN5834_c1_g1_i2:76-783(+)